MLSGPGSKCFLDVVPGRATLEVGRNPELAALVSKPRGNLTRFYGVLAPSSTPRVQVTPAKQGQGNKLKAPDKPPDPTSRFD
jgi:hypothetical protein